MLIYYFNYFLISFRFDFRLLLMTRSTKLSKMYTFQNTFIFSLFLSLHHFLLLFILLLSLFLNHPFVTRQIINQIEVDHLHPSTENICVARHNHTMIKTLHLIGFLRSRVHLRFGKASDVRSRFDSADPLLRVFPCKLCGCCCRFCCYHCSRYTERRVLLIKCYQRDRDEPINEYIFQY